MPRPAGPGGRLTTSRCDQTTEGWRDEAASHAGYEWQHDALAAAGADPRVPTGEMFNRRAIVAVSLVGIVSTGLVSLLQISIVRRLPDPPTRKPRFDTLKVNTSDEAFGYGMPDGPLTLGLDAANLALAAAGPPDRYRIRPWLPVLASALSAIQASVAAKYLFYQMPKVDRAWCPYCIVDALTHFTTFALTLPEARRSFETDYRGSSRKRATR